MSILGPASPSSAALESSFGSLPPHSTASTGARGAGAASELGDTEPAPWVRVRWAFRPRSVLKVLSQSGQGMVWNWSRCWWRRCSLAYSREQASQRNSCLGCCPGGDWRMDWIRRLRRCNGSQSESCSEAEETWSTTASGSRLSPGPSRPAISVSSSEENTSISSTSASSWTICTFTPPSPGSDRSSGSEPSSCEASSPIVP
mmetsp:Transcript_148313/g.259218  ORF Transcript_148313/g.259218 Transcript_148313/m.259218 type:complete len:202 (-) Transcript_148313:964-1569(-)